MSDLTRVVCTGAVLRNLVWVSFTHGLGGEEESLALGVAVDDSASSHVDGVDMGGIQGCSIGSICDVKRSGIEEWLW
jgi:hypothetical protein